MTLGPGVTASPLPSRGWRGLATLALAALGSAVFLALGLPLPWLLGSLVATMAAALAGAPVAATGWIAGPMRAVLGVLLGSAFAPELLTAAPRFGASLALLIPHLAVIGLLGTFYFQRGAGYDQRTAFFCSMPGGLQDMVAIGEALGADPRRVALVHTIRLVVLVIGTPILFASLGLWPPGVDPQAVPGAPLAQALPQVPLLGAVAMAGWLAARAARLPGATIVGPMLLTGGLHLAGLVSTAPPAALVAVAQVVLGAAVGVRFAGAGWDFLIRTFAQSFALLALLLAVTSAAALAAGPLMGVAPVAVFLAFAPGGFAEMGLVALAIGADTSYVAIHHLMRILLVLVVAPVIFGIVQRPPR